MFYSLTTDYILVPVSHILEEAVNAITVADNGMLGYLLADWIMPTVFLRMTGAQEQKLKCICWDMGSISLESRRKWFENKNGEMSCYDEKEGVCKDMLSFLLDNMQEYTTKTIVDRGKLCTNARNKVISICEKSLLSTWYPDDYSQFCSHSASLPAEHLLPYKAEDKLPKQMLANDFKQVFDSMYHQRNRCAHNLSSVRRNYPTFSELSSQEASPGNYFNHFFILILLDQLFIHLFKMVRKYTQ